MLRRWRGTRLLLEDLDQPGRWFDELPGSAVELDLNGLGIAFELVEDQAGLGFKEEAVRPAVVLAVEDSSPAPEQERLGAGTST